MLLGFGMDQITVVHQFADQGIDLAQTEGGLRTTLEVATHETIFVHAHLEGGRASFIDGSGAILFGERKNAQVQLGLTYIRNGYSVGAWRRRTRRKLH